MKKLKEGLFSLLIGIIAPAFCVFLNIRFTQECGGYLKQAADANTVELALERIDLALEYIEANGLTDGYTSVLWKTEDENIGYWYRNIKACQSELRQVLDGTQLEKSNVLMKVRESLTDDGKDGTKLTIPYGISRYPINLLLALARISSYILLIIGLVKIGVWYDEL